METSASKPTHGVGTMLAEALRAKSIEIGEDYSYRDLQRDTGVNYSYVSKVVNGKAKPSRTVLRKWARALAPYLQLDAALIWSGYLPDDPEKAGIFREMASWSGEQWRTVMERRARRSLLGGEPPEEVTDEEADEEPDEDESNL
jgi:transcriptional regulator with XRE-family HTH domain